MKNKERLKHCKCRLKSTGPISCWGQGTPTATYIDFYFLHKEALEVLEFYFNLVWLYIQEGSFLRKECSRVLADFFLKYCNLKHCYKFLRFVFPLLVCFVRSIFGLYESLDTCELTIQYNQSKSIMFFVLIMVHVCLLTKLCIERLATYTYVCVFMCTYVCTYVNITSDSSRHALVSTPLLEPAVFSTQS